MKLNFWEWMLVNNPVRALIQRHFEGPLLLGKVGRLDGKHVLEIGCGCGVGIEVILRQNIRRKTGFLVKSLSRNLSVTQSSLKDGSGRCRPVIFLSVSVGVFERVRCELSNDLLCDV
jgi:hypothetical protein